LALRVGLLQRVFHTARSFIRKDANMRDHGILTQVHRLIAAAVMTAASMTGAVASEPENLDFKAGEAGTRPPGWLVIAQPESGDVLIGEESPELRRLDMRPAQDGLINVMQMIPADAWRGKRVEFRAEARCAAPGALRLWIRVDGADGGMLGLDNMGRRLVRSDTWQDAIVQIDVPPEAAQIAFGVMQTGGGRGAVRSLAFRGVDAGGADNAPPAPLTERGLDNVMAWTNLLGLVRFFHPSDQVAGADWDLLAIHGMRVVEDAADAAELAVRLRTLMAPLAPSVEVGSGPLPDVDLFAAPPLAAQATESVFFHHFGVGLTEPDGMPAIYRTERRRRPIDEELVSPTVVVRTLPGGVWCRVPVRLGVRDGKTLPSTPAFKFPKDAFPDGWRPTGDDRFTRLAGVALAWTVFQHFYPYFDVVETDWDAALPEALVRAAEDSDSAAYLRTLRRLIAHLHDGHGGVMHSSHHAAGRWPVVLRHTADGWVVSGVSEGVQGVQPGDIVLTVDGRAIDELASERRAEISGAHEGWINHQLSQRLVEESVVDQPRSLTLRDDAGAERSVVVRSIPAFQAPAERLKRPETGSELAPGVIYVDLCGLPDPQLRELLPRLAEAQRVIFDLRGYPDSAAYTLMHHLSDQTLHSPQWHVPVITLPDRNPEGFTFQRMPGWVLPPRQPRISGEIVFLTDESAISYAESVMGIVEAYELGAIVGAPTAGTNGNINPFELPGGYFVVWTGMRVRKHDGSEHHGIGVLPTHPVEPTAAGIRAGIDEVLEAGMTVTVTVK